MYRDEKWKLVKCPYDPHHNIRSYRIPYHLSKCKKNHPNVNLVNCTYDFTHLVKREELLSHMEVCPSKIRSESSYWDGATFEHESCKNQYEGDFDSEADCMEDSYHVMLPLETTVKSRDKEIADYIALAKNYNPGVLMKEFDVSWEDRESLHEDELPPLKLPETRSKAFQIKASSVSSKSDSRLSLESENFVNSSDRDGNNYLFSHIKELK